MTKEKIDQLIVKYTELLSKEGADARRLTDTMMDLPGGSLSDQVVLSHLKWMLQELERMSQATPMPQEKIARWIGFIQGVLWSFGCYSVDELREHTREVGVLIP